MKRIDGRHRVFIVVAVVWALAIAVIMVLTAPDGIEWKDLHILMIVWRCLPFWILPIGFTYGIVWAIIWIINGFRKDKTDK